MTVKELVSRIQFLDQERELPIAVEIPGQMDCILAAIEGARIMNNCYTDNKPFIVLKVN